MDQASRSIASEGFNPIILHSSQISRKNILAKSNSIRALTRRKGANWRYMHRVVIPVYEQMLVARYSTQRKSN